MASKMAAATRNVLIISITWQPLTLQMQLKCLFLCQLQVRLTLFDIQWALKGGRYTSRQEITDSPLVIFLRVVRICWKVGLCSGFSFQQLRIMSSIVLPSSDDSGSWGRNGMLSPLRTRFTTSARANQPTMTLPHWTSALWGCIILWKALCTTRDSISIMAIRPDSNCEPLNNTETHTHTHTPI